MYMAWSVGSCCFQYIETLSILRLVALLLFLTLNLSVPLYLRLRQPSVPFYARGIGFLEDIFIVLELFLLTAVSAWLAALVGLLIHLVLMLDSALFKQMQLKLRFSYLVHLQHAGSFYSSAKELGLKKLMGSALAILALHGMGYFHRLPTVQCSRFSFGWSNCSRNRSCSLFAGQEAAKENRLRR